MDGEQEIVKPSAQLDRGATHGGDRDDEFAGKVSQFRIGFLGSPLEDLEGLLGVDAVDEHQHPFGLVDHGPGRHHLRQCFGVVVAATEQLPFAHCAGQDVGDHVAVLGVLVG